MPTRPSLVRPAGIAPATAAELDILRSGGSVCRSVQESREWADFPPAWNAYCDELDDGTACWVSRSAQLLEPFFSGTPWGEALAARNAFVEQGGLRPVLDFDGTVALLSPSEHPDPVLAIVREGERRQESYSADEALASVRGIMAKAEAYRREHPQYDRFEHVDLVTVRSSLVSLEVTQNWDRGTIVGFVVSDWEECDPLPPHFAEYVRKIESGEGAEWI